ncbi:lycopene cyclase [bacterium]|nr:lycopene cyclase [bacterium]
MSLEAEFPQAYKALGSDDHLQIEHILDLERAFLTRGSSSSSSSMVAGIDSGPSDADFDVLIAGGGLSLLYSIKLAQLGFSVAVADKGLAGRGHREWNISREELKSLEASSIFDCSEVDAFIDHRYEKGLVRWHGGRSHWVKGVLDCAVDADAFLAVLRKRAEDLGVTFLDRHRCEKVFSLPANKGLSVSLRQADGRAEETRIRCRLLLDGRGASSPFGNFDIVCPTVGGVMKGLEHDSTVGEILVSTEDVVDGRQHIWEGFPLSGDRLTTYLFYYCQPDTLAATRHPLLALYNRFFRELGNYKQGEASLVRATYGFIPGNTRLCSSDLSPADRIYLLGDAAARHSPLTFCGFGNLIRSFSTIGDGLADLLREDRLDRAFLSRVNCEQEGLRVMGGLALMMIGDRPGLDEDPHLINALLDDAFAALSARGEDIYRDFMQDRIRFQQFLPYMLAVARSRPTVWQEVYRRMSASELFDYGKQIIGFMGKDLFI